MSASLGIAWMPMQRERLNSSPHSGQGLTDAVSGYLQRKQVVLVSRSTCHDCDVDFLFGAVSIESPVIDWSGNCGNLTAAVGPFAIARGLVNAPPDGMVAIRIWQANIGVVA